MTESRSEDVRKNRSCQHCGNGFVPRTQSQKYCDAECDYGANLRKQRGRNKKQTAREHNAALDAAAAVRPARKPQPQRTVFRASSLAETPEIPAVMAARDSMLTGGAPQAGYAHAIGQVGVGI